MREKIWNANLTNFEKRSYAKTAFYDAFIESVAALAQSVVESWQKIAPKATEGFRQGLLKKQAFLSLFFEEVFVYLGQWFSTWGHDPHRGRELYLERPRVEFLCTPVLCLFYSCSIWGLLGYSGLL